MHSCRGIYLPVHLLPSFKLIFFLGHIDCFKAQVDNGAVRTDQAFLEENEIGLFFAGQVAFVNDDELVRVGPPSLQCVAKYRDLTGFRSQDCKKKHRKNPGCASAHDPEQFKFSEALHFTGWTVEQICRKRVVGQVGSSKSSFLENTFDQVGQGELTACGQVPIEERDSLVRKKTFLFPRMEGNPFALSGLLFSQFLRSEE